MKSHSMVNVSQHVKRNVNGERSMFNKILNNDNYEDVMEQQNTFNVNNQNIDI